MLNWPREVGKAKTKNTWGPHHLDPFAHHPYGKLEPLCRLHTFSQVPLSGASPWWEVQCRRRGRKQVGLSSSE